MAMQHIAAVGLFAVAAAFLSSFPAHAEPGAPIGPQFQVNSSRGADYPSVAVDGLGGITVVWSRTFDTPKGIWARRYDARGKTLGPEFRVNTCSAGQATDVAAGAYGSFVITWQGSCVADAGRPIYARRFDAAGMPIGDQFHVSTPTLDEPTAGGRGLCGLAVTTAIRRSRRNPHTRALV